MGNEPSKSGGSKRQSRNAPGDASSPSASGRSGGPAMSNGLVAVACDSSQGDMPSGLLNSSPASSSNFNVQNSSTIANNSTCGGGSSPVPLTRSGGSQHESFGSPSRPESKSVPRYVDANSLVYSLPTFPDGTGGVAGATSAGGQSNNKGPLCMEDLQRGQQQQQQLASSPIAAQPCLAQSTNKFMIGTPTATPHSFSTRRPPTLVPATSTPIVIPTYNASNTAGDDIACSSPMLRSYHQQSFSRKDTFENLSASLTNQSSRRCTGLNTGPVAIPRTPIAASPLTGGSVLRDAATGSVANATPSIHSRFLEITGYPLGLENFGNTCYCNSVIQLLYHCTPLRLRLLELHEVFVSKKGGAGFEEGTVLCNLCNLISNMHRSNNQVKEKDKKKDLAALSNFLRCVREKNIAFRNNMQQDAHEFALFVLNDIMETEKVIMADPKNAALFNDALRKKKNSSFAFWKTSGKRRTSTHGGADELAKSQSTFDTAMMTPLQTILQGQFGSLTACLECSTITARDEVFIDLSLETAQGCSLLYCLDHFGDPEYFYGNNKVRCDACHSQVRAAKTIHVQQLPQYSLIVHLKRFRYDVKQQNFTKKADHVALPMQMDVEEYLTDPLGDEGEDGSLLPPAAHVSTGAIDKDTFKPASDAIKKKLCGVARHKARFELTGFVAHLGEGPNIGHYFTCVRYGPQLWRRFDDDAVSVMTEREVQQCFGVPIDVSGVVTTTAYILLYERVA